MSARELAVIFQGVHHLPQAYRHALSQALSWEAMCYLLNGLSIDLNDLVHLDEIEVAGQV